MAARRRSQHQVQPLAVDSDKLEPADGYAPSPGTCSAALTRANQLRVQALLRQLLVFSADSDQAHSRLPNGDQQYRKQQARRLDTLRVLRRTLRELDYQISWLAQVDFMETMERLLQEESENAASYDWRLVNDCTQLLIETIPRLATEPDGHSVRQILSVAVQNLGHPRSEVRRASLLLLNMYINERPHQFSQVLRIFIDYGLANHRNRQAQRGAILSLPLLMTERAVEGENLLPLVRCLAELLVDADSKLFYSLYLALQRLNLTLGDAKFGSYLRQCDPEAMLLYKQAASRNNSLASVPSNTLEARELAISETTQQQSGASDMSRMSKTRRSSMVSSCSQINQQQQNTHSESEQKQVTFEQLSQDSTSADGASLPKDDATELANVREAQPKRSLESPQSSSSSSSRDLLDSPSSGSSSSSMETFGESKPSPEAERKQSSTRISSSVSSTCSSEAMLVDPSHYMSAAALAGRPLSAYQQLHQQQLADHSSTGLAINDLSVSCTPTIELGPAAQTELSFGIFPRHLISAALSLGAQHQHRAGLAGQGELSNMRISALEEIMCIIRDSPVNHLAILMTYFDSFLEQFLARLMVASPALDQRRTFEHTHQPHVDYRVQLIAIDMIETIVIKTKVSTMNYVRPLIGLLIKPLAHSGLNQDRPASSQMLRDNAIRVIHKMMAYLPPQHVIDAIFEHKHSKSALVREESVNRVTGAVLEYDRNEFNLTKLCYHVLPMLADHHAQVRLAALECIATLAHALGPERIGSLLTAAEAVQTGCDYDGLLDAIHARLMRRSLPRCNPDGSIRYVIKPFLSATSAYFHQEQQAADLRWVLEAPSAHQHVMSHIYNHDLPGHEHSSYHRPGAYSPPQAGRRRSSVGQLAGQLALADAESNHHSRKHHHHHKYHYSTAQPEDEISGQQLQERSRRASKQLQGQLQTQEHSTANRGCSDRSNDNGSLSETPSKLNSQVEQMKSESHHGTPNGTAGTRRPSIAVVSGTQYNSQPASADVGLRKSNSHDSISSTDTNKVLFQYYLSKFRQSLTDSASNGAANMSSVLPSDSIIYTTDTSQVYASSRRKSRQLQTSFDYDPDSVGHISKGSLRSQAVELNQEIMSASSGSPPTVLDAVQDQGPQSERPNLEQGGRRKSLVRSESSALDASQVIDAQVDLDSDSKHTSQQRHQAYKQRQRTLTRQTASSREKTPSASSVDSRKGSREQDDQQHQAEVQAEVQAKALLAESVSVKSGASGLSSSSTSEQSQQQQERRRSRRKSRNLPDSSSERNPISSEHQAEAQQTDQRLDKTSRASSEEARIELPRRKSKSQPPPRRGLARTSSKHSAEVQRQESYRQAGSSLAKHSGEQQADSRRALSVSPSVSASINIRQILENVAELEGPFKDPELALRVAMSALEGPCWSTKVEGLLALIRLASHHQQLVVNHAHEVVIKVAQETQNLRSTVARSAIFALGDFCAKLKRQIEPELDIIVQALLHKSMENTAFIRDDIRRSFFLMSDNLTQWRLANCLIAQGGSHRNVHVRRMASQFVAYLVDRMGAAKCLVGARDIALSLIPAAARFTQDSSPHTRYYGRVILDKIMSHGAFERLARKHLTPNLYRSTLGIIESIKRRGPGEPPAEM